MATYVVMERRPAVRAEDLLFIRDGFHWLAFLVPVAWLLWHRLWIEAAVALGITLLLSAVAEWAGIGLYVSLFTLLVSLYFGMEGAALRVRALARRGWQEWGVLEAADLDHAEMLYAAFEHELDADASAVRPVSPAPVPTLRPALSPQSFGLVTYPGKA